jgi:hypothetical protein
VLALPGFRVLRPSKRPPRRFNVLAMENNIASARTTTPLLWLVLIVSAAVNAGGPLVGLDLVFRMIAGAVALACTVLLITHYVRRRKLR